MICRACIPAMLLLTMNAVLVTHWIGNSSFDTPIRERVEESEASAKTSYLLSSKSVSLGGVYEPSGQAHALEMVWRASQNAFHIKRSKGVFLSCRRGRASFLPEEVTPLSPVVGESELWRIQHLKGDKVVLQSYHKNGYLSRQGSRLVCNAMRQDATIWHMVKAPTDARSIVLRNEGSYANVTEGHDADKILLFGTLKPLKQLQPENASDMFDHFTIARRTLMNWASLPGVQPVVFADDSGNHQLVREINEKNVGKPGFSQIEVIREFELEPQYKLPTYRGLFASAIRNFPSAKMIMYSNSDMMYTRDLLKTVSEVRRVFDVKKRTSQSLRGWYIVAQRTNVNVPANWSVDDPGWEARIEKHVRNTGVVFPPFAQDFFIMNPELFDPKAFPPFIVGGIVFDNWLTAKAVRASLSGEAITVDASRTLTNIHQIHGKDLYASRLHPKSSFNLRYLGTSRRNRHRKTSSCPHYTELVDGQVLISTRMQ